MIKFVILGIVQGLTEFLPVSSSAHLVIVQHIFGIEKNVVFLDVVLHIGTLCSLLVFFRNDIFRLVTSFFVAIIDIVFHRRISYIWKYDTNFRLCIYILIGSAITGYIGLSAKDFFESLFYSTTTVIVALFLTGVILFSTKNLHFGQRELKNLTIRDSIIYGISQVAAIIPGISRSGLTISVLLFRNVDRESAFKFSFLASIPVIAGAFIVKLRDVNVEGGMPVFSLLLGFLFSFFSGLIGLFILRSIVKHRGFYKFSIYCFCLATLLFLLKLKGFF